MKRTVSEFLRTGKTGDARPEILAEDCRLAVHEVVQKSTSEGISMAREFLGRATPLRGVLLLAAYRALGWSLHVATRTVEAEQAYLMARSLSRRDPLVRGRIDRVLIDVYMYLGSTEKAKRHSRLAMSTFRRLGNDAELEKTRINYANLLHRQDKHRQAQKQYRKASEYMKKVGDKLHQGLCQYNEGNTSVQLIEFDRAFELYQSAEKIFEDLDYGLYANEARYGRAWMFMLRGDYHAALMLLSECEQSYRKHGQPRGVLLCTLDRAEAFLGLNLWTDARDAARRSERKARRLAMNYEAAKAALFLAKTAFATGHVRQSRAALRRAEEGFTKENNRPFLATTCFFRAATDDSCDRSALLIQAGRLLRRTQLPVWGAYCDLTLLEFPGQEKSALRRLQSNQAVRSIPHLLALWQTALGDHQAQRGNWAHARKHWTRAANVLDEVRAKLPPVELRSSFLENRGDPYLRMVNAELQRNRAAASAWSERHRTAGLWSAAVTDREGRRLRQEARENLAALAQQVMALSSSVERGRGKRSSPAVQCNRALLDLQQEVRRSLAAAEATGKSRTDSIGYLAGQFAAESYDRTIVQFHQEGHDLLAFIHSRGKTRWHRFIDGQHRLSEFIGWWQTQLTACMFDGPQGYDPGEEGRLFEALGEWLWQPLEVPLRPENVLIIPVGQLVNLPWPALRIGGAWLGDLNHLVIAPSLRHHLHARSIVSGSARITAFVGRADDLTSAHRDINWLRRHCSDRLTVHDPCRRENWQHAGNGHVWHYAGHALLRRDNPFYSSLVLSDGPLFAADFRLMNSRVDLVTLAACRTGSQAYLPGEESSGLVRSLLEMGARNVVASHWAVDDRSTGVWMKEFYRRFLGAGSLTDSVRGACRKVRRLHGSVYHWAAFGLFGASIGDHCHE